MGDRYWISGVELCLLWKGKQDTRNRIIKKIEKKQFLGRIEEYEKETKKVAIVTRFGGSK